MRPKTSESGIFSTKRSKPVSTSMLTRIFVPKPKNAFQSPGVHKTGRRCSIMVITPSCRSGSWAQNPEQRRGCGNRAEDAALGLDHGQAHLVKLGKVGSAA